MTDIYFESKMCNNHLYLQITCDHMYLFPAIQWPGASHCDVTQG